MLIESSFVGGELQINLIDGSYNWRLNVHHDGEHEWMLKYGGMDYKYISPEQVPGLVYENVKKHISKLAKLATVASMEGMI